MQKKLYRGHDKMISGVCSGIGHYFGLDPTLVRVAYAIISIFCAGFPGLILYIVLAIVIPEEPAGYDPYNQQNNPNGQQYYQQPPYQNGQYGQPYGNPAQGQQTPPDAGQDAPEQK